MEVVLFTVSGASLIYYILLITLTDFLWTTQIYWPVTALLFAILGWVLHWDSELKKQRKGFLTLEIRTFLCSSCVLYLSLIAAFVMLVIFHAFKESDGEADYLLLIENSDEGTDLTQADYRALDRVVAYMGEKNRETVKVVLVGSSRFRIAEAEDVEQQSEMKTYLLEQHIAEDRIITEEISSNPRQNIMYGYAYALVDWYFSGQGEQEEPKVGIVADLTSTLRYQLMADDLGKEMEAIHFQEPVLVWPARIMEELRLILRYHLEDAFEYEM